MVRVGRWTLVEVSKSPEWANCDRCDTPHKEVWTCTVDAEAADVLTRLHGKQEWQVGSVCGPKLLEVSEHYWKEKTAGVTHRLQLLAKVEKLIAEANGLRVELPAVIFERRELLLRGGADDKQLRHLALLVGTWTRKLKGSQA